MFLFCFDKTIKKLIKKNVMHKFPDQAGREHNVHIFFKTYLRVCYSIVFLSCKTIKTLIIFKT